MGFALLEVRAFDGIWAMHCLFTYGMNGGTPPQAATIHANIANVLNLYPSYKALGNTYIVKVQSVGDWQRILQLMEPIAKTAPMPLNYIITPLMQTGNAYNGFMPKASWDEINKLTQW